MDFLHSQLTALQQRLSFVATDPIEWKFYVQVSSWTVMLFEAYLLIRQYPLYSKTSPPKVLERHFDQVVFQKSQNYGRDQAKFSLVAGLLRQSINSYVLYAGFYPYAWDLGGKIIAYFGYGKEYEIIQSLAFGAILFLGSSMLDLPVNVYHTFYLEEKYGFNKTTPCLFVRDLITDRTLGFVIGSLFLSAFLYVIQWAGDRFVPWLIAFLTLFDMIMTIVWPNLIQPLYNKLSPLPAGELRTRAEALAGRLKFPIKYLYEIDGSKRSSHSNAFFFGFPWSQHIVIFDTLIKESKPAEVEAVLAHELGHWYYMHPTKLFCISRLHLFTELALFSVFLHAPHFLRAFDFPQSVALLPPAVVAFFLFQMILIPLEAFVRIAIHFIWRRFEWEADRFACELQDRFKDAEMEDMGDRLGRALITLHMKNLSTVWVDWLYSTYHYPHPTLTERLTALDAFKVERDGAVKKEL